jgi:hypothetical protein
LTSILITESEGTLTDEIRDVLRESYRWALRVSKDSTLPADAREREAKNAKRLYDNMPELFEGGT